MARRGVVRTVVRVGIRSRARLDMDRFSTRLAASIIEDRHREAAKARRGKAPESQASSVPLASRPARAQRLQALRDLTLLRRLVRR